MGCGNPSVVRTTPRKRALQHSASSQLSPPQAALARPRGALRLLSRGWSAGQFLFSPKSRGRNPSCLNLGSSPHLECGLGGVSSGCGGNPGMEATSQRSQARRKCIQPSESPPWGGLGQFKTSNLCTFVEYFTVFPRALSSISDLILISTVPGAVQFPVHDGSPPGSL